MSEEKKSTPLMVNLLAANESWQGDPEPGKYTAALIACVENSDLPLLADRLKEKKCLPIRVLLDLYILAAEKIVMSTPTTAQAQQQRAQVFTYLYDLIKQNNLVKDARVAAIGKRNLRDKIEGLNKVAASLIDYLYATNPALKITVNVYDPEVYDSLSNWSEKFKQLNDDYFILYEVFLQPFKKNIYDRNCTDFILNLKRQKTFPAELLFILYKLSILSIQTSSTHRTPDFIKRYHVPILTYLVEQLQQNNLLDAAVSFAKLELVGPNFDAINKMAIENIPSLHLEYSYSDTLVLFYARQFEVEKIPTRKPFKPLELDFKAESDEKKAPAPTVKVNLSYKYPKITERFSLKSREDIEKNWIEALAERRIILKEDMYNVYLIYCVECLHNHFRKVSTPFDNLIYITQQIKNAGLLPEFINRAREFFGPDEEVSFQRQQENLMKEIAYPNVIRSFKPLLIADKDKYEFYLAQLLKEQEEALAERDRALAERASWQRNWDTSWEKCQPIMKKLIENISEKCSVQLVNVHPQCPSHSEDVDKSEIKSSADQLILAFRMPDKMWGRSGQINLNNNPTIDSLRAFLQPKAIPVTLNIHSQISNFIGDEFFVLKFSSVAELEQFIAEMQQHLKISSLKESPTFSKPEPPEVQQTLPEKDKKYSVALNPNPYSFTQHLSESSSLLVESELRKLLPSGSHLDIFETNEVEGFFSARKANDMEHGKECYTVFKNRKGEIYFMHMTQGVEGLTTNKPIQIRTTEQLEAVLKTHPDAQFIEQSSIKGLALS